MKFYIVNNGSALIENVVSRLDGHDYELVDYNVNTPLKPHGADVIILSGGMQNEVLDDHTDGTPYYKHEFDLIRQTNIPIFGICLGLQMTTVALGGTLKKMPNIVFENKHINTNENGRKALGSNNLYVHKKHQWVADDIESTGFNVLATSSEGVELLHHADRRIIATQFHPEVDIDENSEKLFWDLIALITKPGQKAPILAQ